VKTDKLRDRIRAAPVLPSKDLLKFLRALKNWKSMSLGGSDTKAKGGVEDNAASASVVEKASAFTRSLEAAWRAKKCSVLEELRKGLVQSEDAGPVPLGNAVMLQWSLSEVFQRISQHFDVRVNTMPISYLALYLYTQQDVDTDRTFLFEDAPKLPEGKESPETRDEVFREYRAARQDAPRNLQMFSTSNWGTRTRWDKFMAEAEPSKEAQEASDRFLKWQCLISALKQPRKNKLTTARGLCGLSDVLVDKFRNHQKGDKIFWAALSSTTTDTSIAENYANQAEPIANNVLFFIEEIFDGLELQLLSQYPNEQEFVLPLCTLLEVIEVVQGPPVIVRCRYLGSLLSPEFQQECILDLAVSWRVLYQQGIELVEKAEEKLANEAMKAKAMLEKAMLEKAMQEDRQALLNQAMGGDRQECVKLLRQGVRDINATTTREWDNFRSSGGSTFNLCPGATALHLAAWNGWADVAQAVLEAPAFTGATKTVEVSRWNLDRQDFHECTAKDLATRFFGLDNVRSSAEFTGDAAIIAVFSRVPL